MHTTSQLQEYFEKELINIVSSKAEPANLYSPIGYGLKAGGKRVRPLFTLLSASLFQEDIQSALPSAIALEIFHNFTLLHDDIMDRADTRRGKPSVQAKYGMSQALLSGDAMFALAMNALAKSNPLHIAPLVQTFTSMSIDIMEGQQYDMDFEEREMITLNEYCSMIRLKTAVLFGAALKMGAIAVGANQNDLEHLYNSGIAIGMAFQFRDDYLDVYGSQDTFGKPLGGDIAENKKTWLYVKAYELAKENKDTGLEKALNITDKDEKFNAVKSIYNKYHLPEMGEKYIQQYTEEAIRHLNQVHTHFTDQVEIIKQLYAMLAGREI